MKWLLYTLAILSGLPLVASSYLSSASVAPNYQSIVAVALSAMLFMWLPAMIYHYTKSRKGAWRTVVYGLVSALLVYVCVQVAFVITFFWPTSVKVVSLPNTDSEVLLGGWTFVDTNMTLSKPTIAGFLYERVYRSHDILTPDGMESRDDFTVEFATGRNAFALKIKDLYVDAFEYDADGVITRLEADPQDQKAHSRVVSEWLSAP